MEHGLRERVGGESEPLSDGAADCRDHEHREDDFEEHVEHEGRRYRHGVDEPGVAVEARAPGRVNLIGDHTDYTGGLVLPVAIDRWTTVRGVTGGSRVRLRSSAFAERADVPLPAPAAEVARSRGPQVRPFAAGSASTASWTRYVAAVVEEFTPRTGFVGTVRSTVPVGAGLASSAALEVALALAVGFTGDADELAARCRRAEHRATGTPTGIMDQLIATRAVAGHASLIDCRDRGIATIELPPRDEVEIVVVHSGVGHELASSAYGRRVAECERAAESIGPLRDASVDDVAGIVDPVIRARARHVVTENARVARFVDAVRVGDLPAAGQCMVESHASLRDDYAVSIPAVDAIVEALCAAPGVFGARMTGGGFGGCVVALCRPDALASWGSRAWRVRAVGGAWVRRDAR